MPGGFAIFDYNGDGRPDIFFTNGAQTPSLEKSREEAVCFATTGTCDSPMLRRVYKDITTGKPHGEIIGGT